MPVLLTLLFFIMSVDRLKKLRIIRLHHLMLLK